MPKSKKNTVGTITDKRPDGSYIYISHTGTKNLDNRKDLLEAVREDIAHGYDLNEWEY